jgi:hypothetical protein
MGESNYQSPRHSYRRIQKKHETIVMVIFGIKTNKINPKHDHLTHF